MSDRLDALLETAKPAVQTAVRHLLDSSRVPREPIAEVVVALDGPQAALQKAVAILLRSLDQGSRTEMIAVHRIIQGHFMPSAN